MIPSEQELVSALRRREPAAFATLFDAYSDKVYRLAVGLLENETEAECVVQDTFLRIFPATFLTGGGISPSGPVLAENDDGGGADSCGFLDSEVQVTLVAGVTYIIVVDGYGPSDFGFFKINVVCTAVTEAPTQLPVTPQQIQTAVAVSDILTCDSEVLGQTAANGLSLLGQVI